MCCLMTMENIHTQDWESHLPFLPSKSSPRNRTAPEWSQHELSSPLAGRPWAAIPAWLSSRVSSGMFVEPLTAELSSQPEKESLSEEWSRPGWPVGISVILSWLRIYVLPELLIELCFWNSRVFLSQSFIVSYILPETSFKCLWTDSNSPTPHYQLLH